MFGRLSCRGLGPWWMVMLLTLWLSDVRAEEATIGRPSGATGMQERAELERAVVFVEPQNPKALKGGELKEGGYKKDLSLRNVSDGRIEKLGIDEFGRLEAADEGVAVKTGKRGNRGAGVSRSEDFSKTKLKERLLLMSLKEIGVSKEEVASAVQLGQTAGGQTIAVRQGSSWLDLLGGALQEQLGMVDRVSVYRLKDLCSRLDKLDDQVPDVGYGFVGGMSSGKYLVQEILRPPAALAELADLCAREGRIATYVATSRLLPRGLGLTAERDLWIGRVESDRLLSGR